MPTGTAISTTKRKFHKILDSISNASSTSLNAKGSHDKYHNNNNASTTSLPAAVDPPAKKPRTERPPSAYVSPSLRPVLIAHQSPTLRAAAATAKQAMPLTTMENKERKPPNFAPWDRGQFLERLKTYRHVDKWMGKPEGISEVKWAKRGWSCVGKERVGCVGGCGKEVVIILESSREDRQGLKETTPDGETRPEDEEEDEDEWREKAQEQLVEKYAEMIVTAHDGGCLWRRKGCDDTIQRLPLAHHKTAIDDLRHRYDSLLAIASELPPDPSPPPGLDLPSLSKNLSPILHPPPSSTTTPINNGTITPTNNDTATTPSSPPLNHSALALALTGWQAEPDHAIGLATCTACFRRLGLWLFKPPPPTSSSPSPLESTLPVLDLVSEHRTHCPWINPLAQNGPRPTSNPNNKNNTSTSSSSYLTGWETLSRAVNAALMQWRHQHGEGVDVRGLNNSNDNDENGGKGGDDDDDDDDDAASEVATTNSVVESELTLALTGTEGTVGEGEGDERRKGRDERDRERWAKLKRLKRAFHVGRRKGKGG